MSPSIGPATATATATRHVADLRRAFDRSFAEPRENGKDLVEDLLGIGVAAEPYALRLADIRAVVADRTPIGLPGTDSRLLGVAGLRGSIIPVYDLAVVLGHPPVTAPRWLVVTAARPSVALAFPTLDGHLRVARDAIAEPAGDETEDPVRRSFMAAVVRTPAGVRAVIDIAAIHAMIHAAVLGRGSTGGRGGRPAGRS
jgi:purine-binding chemotaxis protein CheW